MEGEKFNRGVTTQAKIMYLLLLLDRGQGGAALHGPWVTS